MVMTKAQIEDYLEEQGREVYYDEKAIHEEYIKQSYGIS